MGNSEKIKEFFAKLPLYYIRPLFIFLITSYFKMDDSDISPQQQTLSQIHKAQQTLDEVQDKMKRFRSQKRQHSQSSVPKAPFPDLQKYFSDLANDIHNDEQHESLLLQNDFKTKYNTRERQSSASEWNKHFENKENNSITLNEKLERQKSSSINKIQQYYAQRSQALEQKLRELREVKEKILRDQKLLLRNNSDLEQQIRYHNKQHNESEHLTSLRQKVQNLKEKISQTESKNTRLAESKKDLEKHVKQVLKAHKAIAHQEVMGRPKSYSSGLCKYH